MPERMRRKLIEVALPLEAINRESAREKYSSAGLDALARDAITFADAIYCLGASATTVAPVATIPREADREMQANDDDLRRWLSIKGRSAHRTNESVPWHSQRDTWANATRASITDEGLDHAPFTKRGGINGAVRDFGDDAGTCIHEPIAALAG